MGWNARSKRFLIPPANRAKSMRPPHGRRIVRNAVAALLLAGMVTQAPLLWQPNASAQTAGQLSALVSVAQTSKTYAHSTVEAAASHGLEVGSAQAELSQGDSLLAQAQVDAQSGSNVAAGIQAAQGAMGDYTSAAVSASVALTNAGLTASVDYSAAVGAVAQVNATVSFMASLSAVACATGSGATSNASGAAKACTELGAQVASASADLKAASSVLVRAKGQADATASLSQAMSMVQLARAEVASAQADIATLASYTYSERGQAYVAANVLPISAKANATIKSEQSLLADLRQFGASLSAYSSSQASAAGNATVAVRGLSAAISQVDLGSPGLTITAAQSTAGQVSSNMSGLLSLVSTLVATPLVTNLEDSIRACASSTSVYESALGEASATNGAFASTKLPAFSSYLSGVQADEASVQADGATYLSACAGVQTALVAVINAGGILPSTLAQLNAYETAIVDLEGSAALTSSGVNTTLQQEASSLSNVQSEISSTLGVLSASLASIFVNGTIVTAGSTFPSQATQEGVALNATASAALAGVGASVQAAAQSIADFVAAANATLGATIGSVGAGAGSLSAASAKLNTQFQTSMMSCNSATAFVTSDTATRMSEAAAGQGEIADAAQLFSSLEVSGGAAALARATLDFQLAAYGSA